VVGAKRIVTDKKWLLVGGLEILSDGSQADVTVDPEFLDALGLGYFSVFELPPAKSR
jgi:hypothetical protein